MVTGDGNGKTIQIKMAQNDIEILQEDVRHIHKKLDDRDQTMDEKFSQVFNELGLLHQHKAKMVGIALGIGGVGGLVGFVATVLSILQFMKG